MKQGKGWYGNKHGHSLASKGIKTKKVPVIKIHDMVRIRKDAEMILSTDKDTFLNNIEDGKYYGYDADLFEITDFGQVLIPNSIIPNFVWGIDSEPNEAGLVNVNVAYDKTGKAPAGAFCSWVHVNDIIRIK